MGMGSGVKAAIESAEKAGADVKAFGGYKNFAKIVDELEGMAGPLMKEAANVTSFTKSPNLKPKTDFKKFFKKQKDFKDKAYGMGKAADLYMETAIKMAKAAKDKKQQAALENISNMCRPIPEFLNPKKNILFQDMTKELLDAWADKKKAIKKSDPGLWPEYEEVEEKYDLTPNGLK